MFCSISCKMRWCSDVVVSLRGLLVGFANGASRYELASDQHGSAAVQIGVQKLVESRVAGLAKYLLRSSFE